MSADRPAPASTDETADLTVWIVRGGREGETVMHNLGENVVTLGWGNWIPDAVTFESADRDALDQIFDQRRENEHLGGREKQRARDQILYFRDEIRIGDLVVLPLKNYELADAWIAIGNVAGAAVFRADQMEGARLRRPVTWLAKEVPRSAVQSDLQRSIQSPPSVFRSRVDDAVSRIRFIATRGVDPGPRTQQA